MGEQKAEKGSPRIQKAVALVHARWSFFLRVRGMQCLGLSGYLVNFV